MPRRVKVPSTVRLAWLVRNATHPFTSAVENRVLSDLNTIYHATISTGRIILAALDDIKAEQTKVRTQNTMLLQLVGLLNTKMDTVVTALTTLKGSGGATEEELQGVLTEMRAQDTVIGSVQDAINQESARLDADLPAAPAPAPAPAPADPGTTTNPVDSGTGDGSTGTAPVTDPVGDPLPGSDGSTDHVPPVVAGTPPADPVVTDPATGDGTPPAA